MSDTATARRWGSDVQFPTNNYLIRFIEEEIGATQKGAPTVKLVGEIVSPEEGEVAGIPLTVVGCKIYHNIYFKSVADGVVDEQKTAKMADMVKAFYEKCGLEWNGNTDNPNMGFKSKFVWATVGNEAVVQRKNPTTEQIKFGRPGDILKHPVTGADMIKNRPTINEWICAGEKPENMAF